MAFPAKWSIVETTVMGAAEPVATSDVKLYARIDTLADDTLIAALTKAARRVVQAEQHRQLVNQTLVMYGDAWPPMSATLTLPRPPLQSVSAVEYVSSTAASPTSYVTMASTDYIVMANHTPGGIRLMPSGSWPDLADVPQAIKVTFIAGTTLAIDDDAALAIKMLATHFYESRLPVAAVADARFDIPYGLKMLIAAGRWGSIH